MTNPIPIGAFELRHIIGRGGMGEVWSGIHVSEGLPVAIKVMTAESARKETYLESFRTEVRAVAALHHPSIVSPLDYGLIDHTTSIASGGSLVEGSPYIVMELALRGSLRKYQHVLGWSEIRVALMTVLEALAHAHAEGIIHRDLKPANVLVGCGNQAPGIKLTDFGLARLSESFERSGSFEQGWGTPQYMAPEQFRGAWRDYGPWTDLYALGCMAFELIDGEPPFEEPNSASFAKAHALVAPRPMKTRFPIPDEFEAWVLRLLQKAPEDRYQFAADAAHALRLMEDPPATRKRQTVSLMPIHKKGTTQPTPQFDDDPWLWDEMDRTIMDRPDTTQVIDEFKIRETSQVGILVNEEALLAHRSRSMRRSIPPMPARWGQEAKSASIPHLYGTGMGLFGLRTIPMVGRIAQRDHMWAALRRVRENRRPEVVLLRGGPGAGKSRLTEWMAKRAHEVGAADFMIAHHNAASGGLDGLPRMLARYMRCVGLEHGEVEHRVDTVLRRTHHTSELVKTALFEVVAAGAATARAQDKDFRYSERITRSDQRFVLLTRYLEAVTLDRPLIIIVDDAQWGAEALAYLNYVLDRRIEISVLFLVSVRDDLLPTVPVEADLMRDLVQRPAVTSLTLAPLNPLETDELVRGLLGLDGQLADEIEERSGGNPLFAVQLVGELVSSGRLQLGRGGFVLRPGQRLELPANIFEIWVNRLKRALQDESESSKITIEIAAALGRQVSSVEWEVACGFAQIAPGPKLLEHLISEGLIEIVDGGWQFEHGLLRDTVERWSRKKNRWEAVNAACTEMLMQRYPSSEFPFVERMANFLNEADEVAASLPYRLDAAHHRMTMSDFARGEEHIRRFHESANTIQLPKEHPLFGRAYIISARAHIERAHFDEGARVAQIAAIEARKNGWHEVLREAAELEAIGKQARGAYDDAMRLLQRALENYTYENDLNGVGRCLLALGRLHEAIGENPTAEDYFERAKSNFEASQNLHGVAKALNALGDAARATGYLHTARSLSEQAMELYQRLENQAGVADCLNDIAELYRMERELDVALSWCMRSIELFESIGSDESMVSRINLALILREGDRHSEALRIFEQVRDHFRATRQMAMLAIVDVHMLASLAGTEEWRKFEDRLQEARTIFKKVAHKESDIADSVLLAAEMARRANRQTLAVTVSELSFHE